MIRWKRLQDFQKDGNFCPSTIKIKITQCHVEYHPFQELFRKLLAIPWENPIGYAAHERKQQPTSQPCFSMRVRRIMGITHDDLR